jgi:hypothetical protein
VVLEEDLANLSIGEVAEGGGIRQTAVFNGERRGSATIGQSLAARRILRYITHGSSPNPLTKSPALHRGMNWKPWR